MTRPYFYILKDKLALPVATAEEWMAKFEVTYRHVATDQVGGIYISTIFLGLDHNFHGSGEPLIFETMIFRGKRGTEQMRCSSWQEAEAQHKEAVALVRREIKERVNQ